MITITTDCLKETCKLLAAAAAGVAVGLYVQKRMLKSVAEPKRVGGVIRLRPEHAEKYFILHAAVWPHVLQMLHKHNIRNYTIYYCSKLDLLFSHMEYIGDDLEADSSLIGQDPVTRDWWRECEPCQKPLQWSGPTPSEGGSGMDEGDSWWASIKEVFHDGHYACLFH